ncbi:MAG: hypothetical protein V1878_11265 [bacterium]
MCSILASWVTVGAVVPVFIAIGLGVLSMNPPDFTIARVSFTFAAIMLLARIGWWIAFEQQGNILQLLVFAFILFGLIGSLWFISMKWISKRQELPKKAINDSNQKVIVKVIVINMISSTLARKEGRAYDDPDIERKSEQKYRMLVEKNTNFLPIDTLKGSLVTLFKIVKEQAPLERFYLLDLVGDQEKNRISLFIERQSVICQILTSTGKKESLIGPLPIWGKGDVHTVIMTWSITKQTATLAIDGKVAEEKHIKNLQFDVLGPVALVGTDFEGNFPAQGVVEFIKLPKELIDLTMADVLGDPKAKIKNGILIKFKQMKAQAGQPLPDKWIVSTYFPHLTTTEKNLFNEAVHELIRDGLVEDIRGNLKLTTKGAELLR